MLLLDSTFGQVPEFLEWSPGRIFLMLGYFTQTHPHTFHATLRPYTQAS